MAVALTMNLFGVILKELKSFRNHKYSCNKISGAFLEHFKANSAFYPQSVSVCFVWFSKYTVFISLKSINQLILIEET
jgi:NurA-like 5'-3' nuclease